MTIPGPALFCRFAFPPNLLGYCGPAETALIGELLGAGETGLDEMRQAAAAFSGAWPYLELISAATGREPLDPQVVEAYWLGNALVENLDPQMIGNSIAERFRGQAGSGWSNLADTLGTSARPTHSFHVFCVYPWVGMLRSGVVEQALHVLDRCRIRWGTVRSRKNNTLLVSTQLLTWDGAFLGLAPETIEQVHSPIDDPNIGVGDDVAMHWGYACQRITRSQRHHLARYQTLHMGMANRAGRELAARLNS
jgi:hypothetical protein